MFHWDSAPPGRLETTVLECGDSLHHFYNETFFGSNVFLYFLSDFVFTGCRLTT